MAIVAKAEVVRRHEERFDVITSDRSYRQGLGFEAAKHGIMRMSGSQFDPVAVDLFLAEEDVLRTMFALKCGQPQSV